MHKPLEHPRAKTSLFVSIALTVLSIMLLGCVAVRLMIYDMHRDEQLYVPPARLLDSQRLYEDFFYNHPPGSAWFFYAIQQITGSDHLLMSGRFGVLLAWVLFAVSVGVISYAITRSGVASWCIAVLTLANELFLTQTGMTATNNFLPLPFSFLGLGLFLLGTSRGRSRPLLVASSGLCLSLSVVIKLNAIAFIPPMAVAAFFLPRLEPLGRRITRVVLPLLGGGLLGALPILYYLARDPARFLAHVTGYHLGPHALYAQSAAAAEENVAATFGAKLMLSYEIWLTGAIAISLAALVALVLTYRHDSAYLGRGRWMIPSRSAVVLVGALLLSVVLSFVPTPAFPQYLAPPLVCLPLALAMVYAALGPEARENVMPAIVAATIVVLFIAAPRLAQNIVSIRNPEKMTVMRVHRDGQAIAARLAAAGVAGKVATLAPIYPLEGGLEVYPGLATGPFAYRIAEITAPDLAKHYRMVSPSGIPALFDADPPAAILIGFNVTLEAPLLAYATAHGYKQAEDIGINDRYGTGVLYIRPIPGG